MEKYNIKNGWNTHKRDPTKERDRGIVVGMERDRYLIIKIKTGMENKVVTQVKDNSWGTRWW